MNEQELVKFGEQIKEQGENQGHTMMDLVFDPISGDFKQVPKGNHHVGDFVMVKITESSSATLKGEEIIA